MIMMMMMMMMMMMIRVVVLLKIYTDVCHNVLLAANTPG